MRSRLSRSLAGLIIVSCRCLIHFPHGLSLNPSFVLFTLKNSFHVNARRVNEIGTEFSNFNQVLHFSNGYLSGCGHHGIEITRSFSINEISPFVALPGFHKGKVSLKGEFHYISAAVEIAGFFVFRYQRANTSRSKKSRNPSSPCANRSEEHTSELQSHVNLVCRLLLEKKKKQSDDVLRAATIGMSRHTAQLKRHAA